MLPVCEINPGCNEKFCNITEQIKELQADMKEVKKSTSENENGKVISKLQIMFDIMKDDSKRLEEKAEKREIAFEIRAEKRDLMIAQISTEVNKYSNISSSLILKVNNIEEKVNALELKVNSNSEKSKIDTSGWFKAGLVGIGTVVVAILIALAKDILGF